MNNTKTRMRRRLERKLADILREEQAIAATLRIAADRDPEEQAIALEGEEVLERRDTMVRHEIEAIRAAITRVELGTYGICTACGGPIGAARLVAIPEAMLCAPCAEREEKSPLAL